MQYSSLLLHRLGAGKVVASSIQLGNGTFKVAELSGRRHSSTLQHDSFIRPGEGRQGALIWSYYATLKRWMRQLDYPQFCLFKEGWKWRKPKCYVDRIFIWVKRTQLFKSIHKGEHFLSLLRLNNTGLQKKFPTINFQYSVSFSTAEYEYETLFFLSRLDFPKNTTKI